MQTDRPELLHGATAVGHGLRSHQRRQLVRRCGPQGATSGVGIETRRARQAGDAGAVALGVVLVLTAVVVGRMPLAAGVNLLRESPPTRVEA